MNDYQTFEQNTEGWPGSSYKRKAVTLKVRRVQQDGRDQAQIEIHVCEVKTSGRLFSNCSSFTLSPEDARKFADALINPSK